MSRDQRVEDNWALIRAQELAKEYKLPLKVVFNLVPKFLEATLRQYSFMIDGLKEVE
jgi:deoxyribodipyrimidine photo-lyase